MEPIIDTQAKNRQEKYAAFLAGFQAANPKAPKLVSSDPALIAEYVVKHAPEGKATEWLATLLASKAPEKEKRGLSIGLIALSVGGLLIAVFIALGIFFSTGFLDKLAQPNVARGLVTFLFVFATIAIFVIASIAVFWASYEEVEKRAGLAKELMAVMIGVLGTILGFYFGSAESAALQPPQEQAVPAEPGDNNAG